MEQKDHLKDLFEKSFENHSFDYDPNQWDALENRLNHRIRLKRFKWLLGSAALVAGIGCFLYYVMLDQKPSYTEKKVPIKTSENTKNLKESIKEKTENSSQENRKSVNPNKQEDDSEAGKNHHPRTDQFESTNPNLEQDPTHSIITHIKPAVPIDTASSVSRTINQKNVETLNLGNNLPKIDNTCFQEEIRLINENRDNLYLVKPNLDKTEILPMQEVSITLDQVGTYYILTEGRENNLSEQFTVTSNAEYILTYSSELTYENGLPEWKAEVQGFEGKIQWYLNGNNQNSSQNKTQCSMNLFEKGNNTMQVSIEDEYGCTSNKSASFTVQEEYNLLAVNAFSPNSIDHRNQSFMPYALVVRNTPFKLMVFDPEDGGIIFETEDAHFPWEGIDKRTGKLVPLNKAFIWRVSLKNPLEGEKPMYQGTIVRF
jgi:hypothetical protein